MRLAFRFLGAVFSTAPVVLGMTTFACGAMLALHFGGERFSRPEIGELVWYGPGAKLANVPGSAIVIRATRLAGQGLAAESTDGTCLLAAAAMVRAGGTLVVMSREADGETLHLRWTGGPTHPAEDCGTANDIRVHRNAFIALRHIAEFGRPDMPEPAVP